MRSTTSTGRPLQPEDCHEVVGQIWTDHGRFRRNPPTAVERALPQRVVGAIQGQQALTAGGAPSPHSASTAASYARRSRLVNVATTRPAAATRRTSYATTPAQGRRARLVESSAHVGGGERAGVVDVVHERAHTVAIVPALAQLADQLRQVAQ